MNANVVSLKPKQIFSDEVTDTLLRIAAAIRSGNIIGLTVVTTTSTGNVDMDVLLLPGGEVLSKKY